jgi:hypothetical protein
MGGGVLAQVEQDSVEDVQQCVYSYLHTVRGERPLSPDFGVEDPTFASLVSPVRLEADIEEAEDRANVTVTVTPIDGSGRTNISVSVELAE